MLDLGSALDADTPRKLGRPRKIELGKLAAMIPIESAPRKRGRPRKTTEVRTASPPISADAHRELVAHVSKHVTENTRLVPGEELVWTINLDGTVEIAKRRMQ
jgi:hypothetical protein